MTNSQTVKCPTCKGSAERRGPYGFIYCLESECVENPASKAARAQRYADASYDPDGDEDETDNAEGDE